MLFQLELLSFTTSSSFSSFTWQQSYNLGEQSFESELCQFAFSQTQVTVNGRLFIQAEKEKKEIKFKLNPTLIRFRQLSVNVCVYVIREIVNGEIANWWWQMFRMPKSRPMK